MTLFGVEQVTMRFAPGGVAEIARRLRAGTGR